jgi:hypothetical protein
VVVPLVRAAYCSVFRQLRPRTADDPPSTLGEAVRASVNLVNRSGVEMQLCRGLSDEVAKWVTDVGLAEFLRGVDSKLILTVTPTGEVNIKTDLLRIIWKYIFLEDYAPCPSAYVSKMVNAIVKAVKQTSKELLGR